MNTAEQKTMPEENNIDEQGNVLYLDEARLERKIMGYRKYRNRSNGIGVRNFIHTHVSARPWNWKIVLWVFQLLVKCSTWLRKDDLKAKLFKRFMMFSPEKERNSGGIVMPLNVDLTQEAQKTVIPVDLIKMAINKADFIGGMKACLCRDGQNCQDYPHDIACLFLGDSGRTVVKNGLAVEMTKEQALERVERASEYGLVGQSLWVEVEQLIWGFRNDKMDHFLEICFCCPCCCVAMNFARNGNRKIKGRFHPSGWTATVNRDICVGCGSCLKARCPQDALQIGKDGKLHIDQEVCVGCGICKTKCPQEAIKIKQTMPMRKNLHEYFEVELGLDNKSL